MFFLITLVCHVINNHVKLEYFAHVTYSVVKVKWNGAWDDEPEVYPMVLAITAHILNSSLSFLQWLTVEAQETKQQLQKAAAVVARIMQESTLTIKQMCWSAGWGMFTQTLEVYGWVWFSCLHGNFHKRYFVDCTGLHLLDSCKFARFLLRKRLEHTACVSASLEVQNCY